jgi:aminoglycoside phosphotransferase (APT) family kinase protein
MILSDERSRDAGRSRIFPHGPHHVVKFHPPGTPRSVVDHELRSLLLARSAGLPVPDAGPVIDVEGRHGLVMERIDGPTMLDVLVVDPEGVVPLAGLLAELHVAVNRCRAESLPRRRPLLPVAIDRSPSLSSAEKAELQALLRALREEDGLCHGDLHPANVILAPDGPRIIDWCDAHAGTAEEEVAHTLWMIAEAPLPPWVPAFPVAPRDAFAAAFLDHRASPGDLDRDQLGSWLRIYRAIAAPS